MISFEFIYAAYISYLILPLVSYCIRLGNKAFAEKNYEVAIQHYLKGIQINPNNHILFSNRSACHFSLQDYDKAADDAKQCIKLNPAFIKGYYRLAQALMEQKDWDGSYNTVRQGLSLDAENAQLTRQLRTIRQQKKKQEAAARQAEALLEARSHATRARGENSDEIRDLQEQYVNTNRELQIVSTNIQKEQREQKVNEVTINEVSMMDENSSQQMYQGVGKMFMLCKKGELLDNLKADISNSQKQEKELKQKREYLMKRLNSQQQNLQELVKT